MKTSITIVLMSLALSAVEAHGADVDEPWVSRDAVGKLHYRTTERGDHIMDFSMAGFFNAGVIDDGFLFDKGLAPAQSLSPSGGDDADTIQRALDDCGRMDHTVGKGMQPRAVVLRPGTYQLSKPLTMRFSYTILRGSGNATVLKLTGAPHAFLTVGNGAGVRVTGQAVQITDSYVPAGATSFHVKDGSQVRNWSHLVLRKPITPEWVHFMGMDNMVRNGKKEKWVSGQITLDRDIMMVEGDTVTFFTALPDSLDAKFLGPEGATVISATRDRIDNIGVEHLRIETPPQAVLITDPLFSGIRMTAVDNAWINDVSMLNVVGAVSVGAAAQRVTVQKVHVTHDVPTKGSAKPADFDVSGSEVLLNQCTSAGDNVFYFVTGARAVGPIVLLDCNFTGGGWIQPHQRWASGLLLDNCHVDGGGIDFMNRGEMGSGHGWTIGWAVTWNCTAKRFIIQNPPGAMNFAIGCRGARETAAMPFAKEPKIPEGTFQSHGTPVQPASLYRAQRAARGG